MALFIFKTDVISSAAINRLQIILNRQSNVIRWSIDVEDIDKVLKVSARNGSSEMEFIHLLNNQNIDCKVLD